MPRPPKSGSPLGSRASGTTGDDAPSSQRSAVASARELHTPTPPLARQVGQAARAAGRDGRRHARHPRLRRGAAGAVPARGRLPAARRLTTPTRAPPSPRCRSRAAQARGLLAQRGAERAAGQARAALRARQGAAQPPADARRRIRSSPASSRRSCRTGRSARRNPKAASASSSSPSTSRKGDQPTAIAELVAGANEHERTRCCSASPARARPSPWPR